MLCPGERSMCPWEELRPAAAGWSVLCVSVRSVWPAVLFKCAVSLPALSPDILSNAEGGVLKSPPMIVGLFFPSLLLMSFPNI